MTSYWTLVLFLLAAPTVGAQSCPWMNAATAGGALGGTVSEKYSEKNGCLFSRGESELRIHVEPVSGSSEFAQRRSQCPAPVNLRAIGNEAFYCESRHIVAGRVRDKVFTLEMQPGPGQEIFRKMADIVAGNLY